MENERKQENGERFLFPFEYIIENLTTSPMLNYFKNSIIITVGDNSVTVDQFYGRVCVE